MARAASAALLKVTHEQVRPEDDHIDIIDYLEAAHCP